VIKILKVNMEEGKKLDIKIKESLREVGFNMDKI